MSGKRTVLSKTAQAVIRLIAVLLLNLGIVFSAVYILFHLLEYYNPHTFIYANMPWLPIVIPILFVLSVLLLDLLRIGGSLKKLTFNKGRMWLIILCDLILFAALSLTLYLKTCTNPLVQPNTIEEYALPTPIATDMPTPDPTSGEPTDSDPIQTEHTPEPTATPAIRCPKNSRKNSAKCRPRNRSATTTLSKRCRTERKRR